MSEEKFDFGNKPTSNWKWFFPPIILLVLHELGGSVRWREVVQGLIGRLDPSEEVLQKTGKWESGYNEGVFRKLWSGKKYEKSF